MSPFAAPPPTSLPDAPLTGADLLGWSALPLLGPAGSDHDGPWLFLRGPHEGWASLGSLADAHFGAAQGRYDGLWPVGDGTLRGVVVDGDALGRGRPQVGLRQIIAEAARATDARGSVLVLCSHRLMPRHVGGWRGHGWPTAEAWRQAAAASGLQVRVAGHVQLDGSRVTVLIPPGDGGRADSRAIRESDRVVLDVSRSPRHGVDQLTALVARASSGAGIRFGIESVAVRKIGKTAVFLVGADYRRYILRIARSPIAVSRGTCNFAALEWLHRSSLPAWVKACVPTAVTGGRQAGYSYFVESCLFGLPGPSRQRRPAATAWDDEAVKYALELHKGTAQPTGMGEGELDRLVREPFGRIRRMVGPGDRGRVLAQVAEFCEQALAGRVLPLVRTHGDLTEANCLFDSGRLSGVVDWEVSVDRGLPLLDLLQLMPIPGETGSHPRWQRFDAWLALWREPGRVTADPVMGDYVRALGVPPEAVPALVLMQWVTHVADRVGARRDDERWLRLRLWQPLESLEGAM